LNKIYLKIKVQASASKNQISDYLLELDRLKIRINAPALKDKANHECMKFMAKTLGVNKKYLNMKSGAHTPLKTIEITCDSTEEKLRLEQIITELKNN
jgi:uncharacterized protein (TIGR00251 family)